METIGERIKRIREGVPLSQKRLGEEAKVEQGYISRWEANKLWPSSESLKRVAEVLSVNHIYLQHGEGDPSPNAPMMQIINDALSEARQKIGSAVGVAADRVAVEFNIE